MSSRQPLHATNHPSRHHPIALPTSTKPNQNQTLAPPPLTHLQKNREPPLCINHARHHWVSLSALRKQSHSMNLRSSSPSTIARASRAITIHEPQPSCALEEEPYLKVSFLQPENTVTKVKSF
ncbi:hypothetical protein V8G54_003708 [Vigna mungo]|uniref:Uncharacterized protein n=1 Tax=Vigna mungo TaxID=3915 RepID=A0AAQ3SAD9_VIGMU